MIDADGSNLVNLSNKGGGDYGPRWSLDGTQVLWYGWPPTKGEGGARIFVNDADCSNLRDLGRGLWPHWSPDGTMIGFFLDGWQDTGFIMNANGSGRRKLIDIAGDTKFVSWSPDGSKVAFSLHTHWVRQAVIDGKPDFDAIGRAIWDIQHNRVYVVNLDGSDLVELTKDLRDYDCYGAAWSPDGTKIAFHTLWGLPWSDIYAVNVDGTNLVRLTKQDPDPHRADGYPRWFQDGTTILFETKRDDNREIYIMNSDASNPVNLTNHPANDWSPSWLRIDFTAVSPQEKLITTWGQIKHGNQ